MKITGTFPSLTIGGIPFLFDQDDLWYWTNRHDESVLFAKQSDCIADAVRWVEERQEEQGRMIEEDNAFRAKGWVLGGAEV